MSAEPESGAGRLNRASGPVHFQVTEEDRAIFDRRLRDFVPPGSFDAHGHLYECAHIGPSLQTTSLACGPPLADWSAYCAQVGQWMGDLRPSGGLFFAFPHKDLDMAAANRLVATQTAGDPSLRGLLLIHPADRPEDVERQARDGRFSGFKVYLTYSSRSDPYNAEIAEFLPEWAWEISGRCGYVIMLHVAKNRAIADPANVAYVRDHCLRYPEAKLILAHCARGFHAGNALDGLASLRSLDNVFFDTSAVCEPQPHEEILRLFGPTRLMFGLDFPVSEMRGRCVSIGDGFVWLDHENVNWSKSAFGTHTTVGIENLLALRQACRSVRCNDEDIERIFFRTAHQVLAIGPEPLPRGQELYREAKRIIPGGTQLFSKRPELYAPEQWPAYYREARGCTVVDLDGRHYCDMGSMGIASCLLGYADPDVSAAVIRRVQFGSMCTLNCPEEVEVARLLLQLHPWAAQVRFARSGGEAMAVAVRIARAATDRQIVAVCGYHGWHDWYLAANLGPGPVALAEHLLPGLEPSGVPARLKGTCLPFRYNHPEELEAILAASREPLAAVVMEPTRSEDPEPGFLQRVKELCRRHGAKLVFDEISIGWKLATGGAHLRYGVTPDIAVFGKSLGNGHAMSAVIGVQDTMEAAQHSFISSTFWTEGVGPAAALASVRKMMSIGLPGHLARIGSAIKQEWQSLARRHGLPIRISGHDAMCGFAFDHPKAAALETLFTARMLRRGFLATPRIQVSLAHQIDHVEAYARAVDQVFAELAEAVEKREIEERIGGPIRIPGFVRLTP